MNKNEMRQKLSNSIYYIVVFVVSLLVVVFVPMVSVDTGISLKLPESTGAWMVFIFTRLFVAVLNMIIFASFVNQAKLNVKNDEKFKEANQILGKIKMKEYIPESPKVFMRKTYLGKGFSLLISSVLALFAISQAVIVYDYNLLLSYAITLIMGIVMGIMQMTKTEEYWTTTYYDYAKMKEREFEELKKEVEENVRVQGQKIQEPGGTSSVSE